VPIGIEHSPVTHRSPPATRFYFLNRGMSNQSGIPQVDVTPTPSEALDPATTSFASFRTCF